MQQNDGRREFLWRAMTTAGAATLLPGALCGIGVARAGTPGETNSPTARFLDAVLEGDLARVRQALDLDPGLVHVRDEAGRSAFALALLQRHGELAELLRERGHQPDLHESALAVDWERFESLARQTPGVVNQDHPLGGTAMYAAAFGGAGTQIWRIYRYGGEPDESPRGKNGHSAVRAALEHPDLALAELTVASLLGNGADPGGPQLDGSSALHAAARRGSVALVELLICKGADVDARDRRERTALELALESGQGETAAVLRSHREIPRDHSTSRTAYDVDGKPYAPPDLSAFSVTTRGQVVGQSHTNLDAVRQAVERHPGLVHSVATTTEGAVEAGAHMGRGDIVDFLLGHGAPYSLPTAVMRNDLEHARVLLEEDPLRVNERGAHDFPLLWYPVIGKDLREMAELLIDHGARVERQHWLGTTALHYAAIGGQTEMAALLIERGGADVNRVGRKFDPAGVTALQIAEARGHESLAKLLRERGARS